MFEHTYTGGIDRICETSVALGCHNFDIFESVEAVEFFKVRSGVVVTCMEVLHDYRIGPSHSSLSGRCTEFFADYLQPFTDRIRLLCLERFPASASGKALSHASGLYD